MSSISRYLENQTGNAGMFRDPTLPLLTGYFAPLYFNLSLAAGRSGSGKQLLDHNKLAAWRLINQAAFGGFGVIDEATVRTDEEI